MAPKFGTSGLRGLVVELTDTLVADHVRAFLAACDTGPALYVGRDLRDSSPHLATVVAQTARDAGVPVVDCGALPTPALALAALAGGAAAVMVTGSHIPADRNGLKFYTVAGEITKTIEAEILAALGRAPRGLSADLTHDKEATHRFHARYRDAFGADPLSGARIGVYSHSSVGRDLLLSLLADLGAEVVELGRSDSFIPVDTEAVDAGVRAQLRDWATDAATRGAPLDAIVSTDGDADRPLLTDAAGEVVAGDVLGQITSAFLAAEVVVTPVSSNSGIDRLGLFDVVRSRIGSPYVIAAMQAAAGRRVVGYEANGGYLLGFDARIGSVPAGSGQAHAQTLPALATRDCVLPILATLVAARQASGAFDVAARIAAEPARFTAADRLEGVPVEASGALLSVLTGDPSERAALLASVGLAAAHTVDTTDGLRMTDAVGTVLHLRPSGNAPEFRIYVEADSAQAAQSLTAEAMSVLARRLTATPG